MKILFVSATPFEITPLTDFLKQNWVQFGAQQYQKGEHSVEYLITGVGIPATIFQLTKKLSNNPFDLVINAGIAGAFNRAIELGSVWEVVEDRFADIGVEQADGAYDAGSSDQTGRTSGASGTHLRGFVRHGGQTGTGNRAPDPPHGHVDAARGKSRGGRDRWDNSGR